MKLLSVVATAALAATVLGATLPALVISPNKAASNENPHRRPTGPVFGETCKTENGVETCPRCIKLTPKKTCEKFDWFTPDDAKADAFDKAKERGDSCGKKEQKCAGEKGYAFFEYVPCCDGFACAKDKKLGWGRFCLPKEDVVTKTCTKDLMQCEGAKDKEFVDWAPCCSAEYQCVTSPARGFGKYCVPMEDVDAEASAEEELEGMEEPDVPVTVAATTAAASTAAAATEAVETVTAAEDSVATATAIESGPAAAAVPETNSDAAAEEAPGAAPLVDAFNPDNAPAPQAAAAPAAPAAAAPAEESSAGLSPPSGGLGGSSGLGGGGGPPSLRILGAGLIKGDRSMASNHHLKSSVRNKMVPHGSYETGQRVVAGISGRACAATPTAPTHVAVPSPTATESVYGIIVSLGCQGQSGVSPEIAATVVQAVCVAFDYPASRCLLAGYDQTRLYVVFRSNYPLSTIQGQIAYVTQPSVCGFQRFVVQNAVCSAMTFQVSLVAAAGGSGAPAPAAATTAAPATDSFGCRTGGSLASTITTPAAHASYDLFAITYIVRCSGSGRRISAADANRMVEALLLMIGYSRNQVGVVEATTTRLRIVFYVQPSLSPRAVEIFNYYFGRGDVAAYLGMAAADLSHTASVLTPASGPAVVTTPAATTAAPAAAALGCRAGAAVTLGAKPPATQGNAVFTTTVTFTCTSGTTNNADAARVATAIAAALGLGANTWVRDTGSGRTVGISYYAPVSVLGQARSIMTAATSGGCSLQVGLGLGCGALTTATTITVQPAPAATTAAPTSNCRIRKECQSLTAAEWTTYANAVLGLMGQPGQNGGSSRYDDFVVAHSGAGAIAHNGAQFFPWHRAFLKLYEDALRTIEPTATLCYWDWSVDATRPGSSGIWGLFGRTSGSRTSGSPIQSGRFTNLMRYTPSQGRVMRSFTTGATGLPNGLGWDTSNGQTVSGYWATTGTINGYIQDGAMSFERFATQLEMIHGTVHNDIGSDMLNTAMAPNDPIFYAHHTYIDYIWSRWQATGSNRNKYGGTQGGRSVSTGDRLLGYSVSQILAQSGSSNDLCVTYQTGRAGSRMLVQDRQVNKLGAKVVRQSGRCNDNSYKTNVDGTAGCVKKVELYCRFRHTAFASRQTSFRSAAECKDIVDFFEAKSAAGNGIEKADLTTKCGEE